jgi:hypothetical protein
MDSSITLTNEEQLALNILKASGEIQKIARPDGTVALEDLYGYFQDLARHLEFSQKRRRGNYIDVTVQ